MQKHIEINNPSPFIFSHKLKGICASLGFLGLIALVFGLKMDSTRTWQAFLMGFFFFTSLSLISLFFLSLQHLTSAQWSVNIRRIFESFAAFLPYGAGLMIILAVFGAPELYKWLDPEIVAGDALIKHKAPYLNKTFFFIRSAFFFTGWILFSKKLTGNSLKQDETGDDSLIKSLVPVSVGYIVFFTLSYSLFCVDLLMSLEPHWFSTIFGVYLFGGAMQTLMASSILLILFLCKKGLFNGLVTMDHVHDLGKFLLGFTVFWAYIAFSQYMLIWYANMPEETVFFMHRSVGSWMWVSLGLLFFKFIIPFLMLLPRWAKRTPKYLGFVCSFLILTQFLDLYWLIYPNFDEHHASFSFYEIFISLGFAGIFCFATFKFLSSHSLVPMKDPRLKNSVAHEVVY